MIILGLHFGHDAAVSVLIDGRLAAYVLRERHSRIKHAITLQWQTIETALASAGIGVEQIDYCAITSTQEIEFILHERDKFSLEFSPHPRHTAPCSFADVLRTQKIDPRQLLTISLMEICYGDLRRESWHREFYQKTFPEHRERRREEFWSHGWIEPSLSHNAWRHAKLAQIAEMDLSTVVGDEMARFGFHLPVTVNLAGRSIAGYFVSHHIAHAASVFYQSGFTESAIFTHDGYASGGGDLSGLLCYGIEHRLYPVAAHHLVLGGIYDEVGVKLNLGVIGPAGKLMGLAAYGKPTLFDPAYIGNAYDYHERNLPNWYENCLAKARELGFDFAPLGDPAQMTAPINADIAASTQKLIEEGYLATANALHQVLRKSGRNVSNLCLSGGCALNCPSNTRLLAEGPFEKIYIEPGCDDSGLAIGAALYLHHNVFDQPMAKRGHYASPYIGVDWSAEQIDSAIAAAGDAIRAERIADNADAAASDVAADRVIAWFEGRSEIGPRALGHRSILADPRKAENWQRINKIKGREWWRPLAPAVLESEAEKWFEGMPLPSPYMLFNARVKSDEVPAVKHIDGSARVQTVDPSCGGFFRVVEKFFEKTHVPLVLNTSFNGPGEPIVESPADALRFFAASKIDALYMGGYRITRS